MWLVGKTVLKPGSKKGCIDTIEIAETLVEAEKKYLEFENERETYSVWLCPVFKSTDHDLPNELSHLQKEITQVLEGTTPPFRITECANPFGWTTTVMIDNGMVVTVEMLNAESARVDVKTLEQHKRSLPAFSREFSEQDLMAEGYKRSAHAYEIQYHFAKEAA